MTFFATYQIDTGMFMYAGSCAGGQVMNQIHGLGPNVGVIETASMPLISTQDPNTGHVTQTPDYDVISLALKTELTARINTIMMNYLPQIHGQSGIYADKKAEALSWTPDDHVAHPEKYPYMIAESRTTGEPVPVVRGNILAQVDQYTPVIARIEAARVNAGRLVYWSMPNITAAVSAINIDWDALLKA